MNCILRGLPGERHRLVEQLEAFCHAHAIPSHVRNAADLAIEEHVTNVLSYGFPDGMEKVVEVDLQVSDGALVVTVTDFGIPFNPLDAPPVDTSIPLEQKPIGGLGVHLMRQFMDDLIYTRDSGRNVLRMTKRLAPA